MGVTSSRIDDDKPLQLCRDRKKLVRQALDGRCALAVAHVAYIRSLKITGTAFRKFVQPDIPVDSSLYTSTSGTPEPLASTEKSLSPFSSSQSNEHPALFSSPPTIGRYQMHRMDFRGSVTRKVEEKPPVVVTGTVTSLSTPQNTAPWDYFDLFNPIDDHLSFNEQKELDNDFENKELEQVRSKISFDESQGSESNEFDDHLSDSLLQSVKYVNREEIYGASPIVHTAGSVESEHERLDEERIVSPKLSPLKPNFSGPVVTREATVPFTKDDDFEHKIAPKDFFSSIREVERLFAKASESGKEVPRMLEANKLHFRPLLPGQESGVSTTASFLKACFACGKDPSQLPEEPAQSSAKYLTWHRTTSFRSSSSRNFLDSNSREDVEDFKGDLFENSYKISGSHASTLDRLFAWEGKLYDEVKASQMVRRAYDMKCKHLREQESKNESHRKIDKTRAVIKDLHTRIRVSIHRINSISRRIEEIRDKELQPQLEELIEGLRRMWEEMFDCHKLQVHIISVAFSSGTMKLSLQSESRRHITLLLEEELCSLSLNFMRWINALKFYVRAINDWLNKCVRFQETSKKKRKWAPPPHLSLRNAGPPIYTTCGAWLDSINELELPVKETVDTIKGLAAEVSRLVPQEKGQGRKTRLEGREPMLETQSREAFEEWNTRDYDQFQSSLVIFLSQICNFAERSLNMYLELQTNIEDAKRNYEHKMSQP